MDLKNKTILVISPERWGTNHVSKHHIARELSFRGCMVYFLDPPGKTNELLKISERLTVIKYKPKNRGLNRLPDILRLRLVKHEVVKLLKRIDCRIEIVWSFDPYRFQDLHLFEADYTIFHSADFINSKWDLYVAQKADLVLTTNRKILNRYKAISGQRYMIGHGLSDTFINPILEPLPSFKQGNHRISVGYCGNLLMKYLDRKTLKAAITDNMDLDFYFIGPFQVNNLSIHESKEAKLFVEFIDQQPNCFLLGQKSPDLLHSYLKQIDIMLICYKPDSIANPHKTLEYLCTGKVVVSNFIAEYEIIRHLIEMPKNDSNLSQVLSSVAKNLLVHNSRTLMHDRMKFAKERTYKNKLNRIEGMMLNSD